VLVLTVVEVTFVTRPLRVFGIAEKNAVPVILILLFLKIDNRKF
jgi:hypothetical protein